jgi:anthranilate synthase/aminodeoxychorismate synthase-like glutamine amidotransferase
MVVRNDAIMLDAIAALGPDAIVLGPGPGEPADAGITIPVIKRFGASVPILGVCLGHQAIGEAYGGDVIRAPRGVMHGKTSRVQHDGTGLFAGIDSPAEVMRYHSLSLSAVKAPLRVTGTLDDGTVMAVEHETLPVLGLQFHPDSYATPGGRGFIDAFFRSLT